MQSGHPDFPFCVCWANENWSRRWDGLHADILIAQQHSDEDDLNFIKSLEPALRDRRYIRVNDRPLLLVYRVSLLPDPGRTASIWRRYCHEAGLGDLYSGGGAKLRYRRRSARFRFRRRRRIPATCHGGAGRTADADA